MPTNAHLEETQKEDGTPSEKLVVEFTNGSLQQLRELGEFFKVKESKQDPYKVLEFAVGLLETIKEKNPDTDSTAEK